jgi:hypothetical protein
MRVKFFGPPPPPGNEKGVVARTVSRLTRRTVPPLRSRQTPGTFGKWKGCTSLLSGSSQSSNAFETVQRKTKEAEENIWRKEKTTRNNTRSRCFGSTDVALTTTSQFSAPLRRGPKSIPVHKHFSAPSLCDRSPTPPSRRNWDSWPSESRLLNTYGERKQRVVVGTVSTGNWRLRRLPGPPLRSTAITPRSNPRQTSATTAISMAIAR